MAHSNEQTVNSSSREVVAALITCRGKLALFQRSHAVTGDCGKWHCITGFLDHPDGAAEQVLNEIREEASLAPEQLELRSHKVLIERDGAGNEWRIHAYHFESDTKSIQLNWENDQADWVLLRELQRFATVSWLGLLIGAFAEIHTTLREMEWDQLVGWA
ncbi:MAG: NUDIX domain-containing protein [Gammaproteobacteria bacterium]|nr:NUDIX domain-containing protein [Gammaproteobacteria bacterium]